MSSNKSVEGSSWFFVQFRYDVEVRQRVVVLKPVAFVELFVLFENIDFLSGRNRCVCGRCHVVVQSFHVFAGRETKVLSSVIGTVLVGFDLH